MVNYQQENSAPDTFICHASDDKQHVARPLRDALENIGVHAWLDESEVRVGDSIRRKIDEGLSACRSATVILSRPFFEKHWTQYEMDGILQRQVQGEILLFPIRHGITIEEIRSHSPSLADIASLNSSDLTIERIAAEIAERISRIASPTAVPATTPEPVTHAGIAGRTFGVFYIASEGTEELPPNSEPERSGLAFFGNYTGWLSMVKNNEELEFTIEGKTLRLRLDWGNSWDGSELQAATLATGTEPFALTIRRTGRPQLYFPSLRNQNPQSPLTGQRSRSGWMTFLI